MSEIHWNRLKAAELGNLAAQDAIVLLPVAATEQHGPHLPTGTDTFLCTEACARTASLVQPTLPIVVAPTLWMGLSEHHMAFGGTFTLSLPTWHAILREICQSILRAGFKKIVIVNGHGGNITALNALTVDLTRETGAAIATTTYFTFADDEMAAILDDQDGVQHACEAETSMIMATHPDLVDPASLDTAFGPNTNRASALGRQIHVWKSFQQMTPNGIFGDARKATQTKGEAILNAIAKNFATKILAGEPWE